MAIRRRAVLGYGATAVLSAAVGYLGAELTRSGTRAPGDTPSSGERGGAFGVGGPTSTSGTRSRVVDAPFLGEEGSLFYRQLGSREPPLVAREEVLVTPREREDECADDCPAGMRIVGGERGSSRIRRMAASLDPVLWALANRRELPQAVRSALAKRLQAGMQDPAKEGAPMRVLGIAEPRPELGQGHALVALVFFDAPDPILDAQRARPATGGLLMITRREMLDPEGRPRLVEGLIEFGETGGERPMIPPEDPRDLSRLHPPGMRHFDAVGRLAGLHLDEAGRLFAFDDRFERTAVAAPTELVEIVRLVLRRA